jgi:hypothetical protein
MVRSGEPLKAIEGARVSLQAVPDGKPITLVTGPRGEFAFQSVAPGKYLIEAAAIGYGKMSAEIEVKSLETVEVEFEAAEEGLRLPELAVVERPNMPADFVRRSESGGGRYVGREEIARREGTTLGNLLRTFPGLRVDCRRSDRARHGSPCVLQLTRAPRNCPMAYWMDGSPADANVVMFQPTRELDGIEI